LQSLDLAIRSAQSLYFLT